MSWLDKLERRFGYLGIPGLIRCVAMLNALVFVLYKLQPGFLETISLDPQRVMAGEVWRLVSYIFIPNIGGVLTDWLIALFYIWFLWWIGDGLEQAMGSFKTTIFYVLGMIGTTGAAFVFPDAGFSAAMLNNSLFFAFARFYPDVVIYLFMILPVKVKWLAWVNGAFLLLGFMVGTNGYRMAVIVALANFLLFFGRDIWQEAVQRKSVAARRQKFESAKISDAEPLHNCAICHRTEQTHPDLEFRVAGDGEEYCREHLPVARVS